MFPNNFGRHLLCIAAISFSGCISEGANSDTESNTPIIEENGLRTGLTHFYFDNWDGPTIPVWMYVPHNVDVETAPIMFMMHGAKRGAARYLSEWDHVADKKGFIVVAPEFNKTDFRRSSMYQRGNMRDKNGDKIPEQQWTFSAINPIFENVKARIGNTQHSYSFYGHSAGSQFVHRALLFKTDLKAHRFLPANAGWYTFADLDIDYPYGLKGTHVTEDHLKAVLQKDVVILLGDQDNDANHSSLNRSDGAAAQGPHRFARGKTFYENAKQNAEKYGVDFGWQLRIVPDVAHSNGLIALASNDLIE